MRNLFSIVILLFGVFCAPATHAAENNNIEQATNHIAAGNYDAARVILEPLEQTDPAAQYLLGYLADTGLGVRQSIDEAIRLYTEAGNSGNADAQFALGELALKGERARQSDSKALGWYTLASAQGHIRAKARLGLLYAQGRGTEPDPQKAASLHYDAAMAGEPDAQFNLAIAYSEGKGVTLNTPKATSWFLKAADAGHPGAMVALGLMTHANQIADTVKSPADWFEQAAKAGDRQGQFLYAVALTQGDDRNVDLGRALALIEEVLADTTIDAELRQNAEALRTKLG